MTLSRFQGKAHVCAVIFTDNSGVDIVLGVLPFARELLKRKTKVILCANAEPSLNDVTYTELVEIIDRCCSECDIINQAYKSGKLLVYENGQYGCCLNFLSIPQGDFSRFFPTFYNSFLSNFLNFPLKFS